MELNKITFTLNGIERSLSVGDLFGQLKPNETLIETLREPLWSYRGEAEL